MSVVLGSSPYALFAECSEFASSYSHTRPTLLHVDLSRWLPCRQARAGHPFFCRGPGIRVSSRHNAFPSMPRSTRDFWHTRAVCASVGLSIRSRTTESMKLMPGWFCASSHLVQKVPGIPGSSRNEEHPCVCV